MHVNETVFLRSFLSSAPGTFVTEISFYLTYKKFTNMHDYFTCSIFPVNIAVLSWIWEMHTNPFKEAQS